MTSGTDDDGYETRAGEVPSIIQLPDETHPEPPPERPKPGRHTGNMKGRHFGPRPVADPRTAWLTMRCTPTFRAAVLAAAEEAGLSLADYVHERLGGQPARRVRRKRGPDTEWQVKMLAALGRSGNNLNQLLRRVNSYDFRDTPELLEMQAAMKIAHAAHRELCEAIMTELGV